MTIKEVSLEYDALNSKNIFTNGDTINGRIIVQASKDTRICSLVLRVVGTAHVSWLDENDSSFSQQEDYYSIKHCIIRGSEDGKYKTGHPQPRIQYVTVRAVVNEIKTKAIEQWLLLQPLLSLAKEEMYFLSLSSSPTGQDLLFYHHTLRGGVCFSLFTWFDFILCHL